jgi:hypothetical protein
MALILMARNAQVIAVETALSSPRVTELNDFGHAPGKPA